MIFLFFACGTQTADRPALQDPSPVSESEKKSLVQQLSVREGFSCSHIKRKDSLLREFSRIVEEVDKPAWVPMRAVACMIEIFPAKSRIDLEAWIIDPNKKGIAFLIAGQIEKIPDQVALSVIKKGLQGPHAVDIRTRLEKLNDPRLQSLLYPNAE